MTDDYKMKLLCVHVLVVEKKTITPICFTSVAEMETTISTIPHCLLPSGWLAGVGTKPAPAHATSAVGPLLDGKVANG